MLGERDTRESFSERRLKKKACAERAVIDGSLVHLVAKCDECATRIAFYKKRIDKESAELLARYDAGEDIYSVSTSLSDIESHESKLAQEERLLDMFKQLKDMLTKLLDCIDALIRVGDYKFVIATVPEKKIPKYVKAAGSADVSAVVAIIAELLTKIQDHFTVVVKGHKEFGETVDRINSVAASMRAGLERTAADDVAAIEALRARTAARGTRAVPVPAQMEQADTRRGVTNEV